MIDKNGNISMPVRRPMQMQQPQQPQQEETAMEKFFKLTLQLVFVVVSVLCAMYGINYWIDSLNCNRWQEAFLRWLLYSVVGGVVGFILFNIYSNIKLSQRKKNLEVEALEVEIDSIRARNEYMRSKANIDNANAETERKQSDFKVETSSKGPVVINFREGVPASQQVQFFTQHNVIEDKTDSADREAIALAELTRLPANEIFERIYDATTGLQNCPSLIVAGEKRSGKSTFLEWMTNEWANEAEFIVVDPKQDDPLINWGPTTVVVGKSQNWQAISDMIDDAREEIKHLKVDPNRKKRFYIFDEWLNLLAVNVKFDGEKLGDKVFDFMLKVLTELSYLGIGVIVGPHSTTKTALGFPPGFGELKNNFDGVFRFIYSLFTEIRQSFFENKGKEFEIPLWNPKTARRKNSHITTQQTQQTQRTQATEGGDKGGISDAEHTASPASSASTASFPELGAPPVNGGEDAEKIMLAFWAGATSLRELAKAAGINPDKKGLDAVKAHLELNGIKVETENRKSFFYKDGKQYE